MVTEKSRIENAKRKIRRSMRNERTFPNAYCRIDALPRSFRLRERPELLVRLSHVSLKGPRMEVSKPVIVGMEGKSSCYQIDSGVIPSITYFGMSSVAMESDQTNLEVKILSIWLPTDDVNCTGSKIFHSSVLFTSKLRVSPNNVIEPENTMTVNYPTGVLLKNSSDDQVSTLRKGQKRR
ncbi:hypothetical protein TEA_021508 [Camellia sinensis var. sinensis]|uniref:Uncharacterized protein n=1 Tax=Camellia sinensis var. sinensis TaxID=542762 RepID=A0A4S4DGC4_CAMSN|nr:hypothetical protein TEA_021508 [Camellia sinensis var. sinensis]